MLRHERHEQGKSVANSAPAVLITTWTHHDDAGWAQGHKPPPFTAACGIHPRQLWANRTTSRGRIADSVGTAPHRRVETFVVWAAAANGRNNFKLDK